MEEAIVETGCQWRYTLLRNGACVSLDPDRSSLEVGNEELLIRVQGVHVSLFAHGEPVKLAPYLVYASPNIAGTIQVREYEGVIEGNGVSISCFDADIDIVLISRDGIVWNGMSRYQLEWGG